MTNAFVEDESRRSSRRAILVQVPAGHYGIRLRFGRRIPGVLSEGLHFKIPFVEEIAVISMHVDSLELTCSFTAADRRIVGLEYSVQYCPDPTVTVMDGPNKGADVFACVPESEIPKVLSATFNAQLGAIGAAYESSLLLKAREPLQVLLNSVAKLGSIPHERHAPGSCGEPNCAHRIGLVPPEERLAFYREHNSSIQDALRSAEDGAQSRVETQCGIRVVTVQVTDLGMRSVA